MYLVGAELTGKTGFVSMALVQRVRKDLKKHYHVFDVKRSSFSSGMSEVIEEISLIYNDRKYITRKPRFSQIGRPKKIVNEKPLVFISFGHDTGKQILHLKNSNIPAVCVFFTDENEWRTEVPGKCLKSDFYISKNTLIDTILNVVVQNRINMTNIEVAGKLNDALNEYRKAREKHASVQDVKPLDDLALALAMPVWYYENLLSIRPRTP